MVQLSLKMLTPVVMLFVSLNQAIAQQTVVGSPTPAPADDTDANQVVISIMLIITVLIGMTCLFELGKDYLLENSTELMRPIVAQMFSECTVLGFLSLVVFLLEETQVLTLASVAIFGHSDEAQDEILELTEKTHYMIFLVMAVTIFQVIMLVI